MISRWFILLCLVVLSCKSERSIQPHQPLVTRDAPAPSLSIPPQEVAVIEASRAALAHLATRSPLAGEFLAFYTANAVPAKSLGEGGMQVVNTPAPHQTHPFFIYAVPRGVELRDSGVSGYTFARFSCRPAMMMLHGGEVPDLARGLLLAHELQHAKDCLENGEPESAFLDDNWLLGELNAHALVNRILNEWSQGSWSRIVADSRSRREVLTIQHGSRPESSMFGNLPEDRELIIQTFGASDPVTLGLLHAQLDIDAAVMNVDVQMTRYGQTDDRQRVQHYIDIARAYYTQHADAIMNQS